MKRKKPLMVFRIERIMGSLLLACLLLAILFLSATPTQATVDQPSTKPSSVIIEGADAEVVQIDVELPQIPAAVAQAANASTTFALAVEPNDPDVVPIVEQELAIRYQSGITETPPSTDTNDINLDTRPTWRSSTRDFTTSLAWGDVDGDGDLDLAVGNGVVYDPACRCDVGGQNQIYLNNEGQLETEASWTSSESDDTSSVAWADVDGDGDLDLAVGNRQIRANSSSVTSYTGAQNKVYLNEGTMLESTASWVSDEAEFTTSVAWGDVNGDGHFDLAVANSVPDEEGEFEYPALNNRVYLNTGNGLEASASWASSETDETNSVAWGDADGDGDLDLAVGNNGTNRLYRNDNGVLTSSATWNSPDSYQTSQVAWADVDLDDDLDLNIANVTYTIQLYLNEDGDLGTPQELVDSEGALSLALGDADNDGDLDLGAGHDESKSVYHNKNGQPLLIWELTDRRLNNSVGWADIDKDGDLDFVVGSGRRTRGEQNTLFANNTIPLADPSFSDETDHTQSIAWGDVDDDGDLDLAVGNIGEGGGDKNNKLYLNDNGRLSPSSSWQSDEKQETYDIAWGDVDGDGDLDLVAGNSRAFDDDCQCYTGGGKNKLYLNKDGQLQETATWVSDEVALTFSVAWADVDSDGDLDLAVGNQPFYDSECECFTGGENQLYLNENGMLATTAAWSSEETDTTKAVAWADVDGDGDLDLAVGNDGSNRLYLNDSGTLTLEWSSTDNDATNSIAWGDYDADGDPDLMFGNYLTPNKLYQNNEGELSFVWSDESSLSTSSVAWGDVDNDGDLDLGVGNLHDDAELYLNQQGQLYSASDDSLELASTEDTHDLAWADIDLDGDLDVALGVMGANQVYLNQLSSHKLHGSQTPSIGIRPRLAPANFYATPKIHSGHIISIAYKLTEEDQIDQVRGYFSLDGGGLWLPAVEAKSNRSNRSASASSSEERMYHWDVSESGFFGQSDNVAFRLEASLKQNSSTNNVPGPFLLPSIATTSYPFRARGNQIQVLSGTVPVENAQVYRLAANAGIGTEAQPLATTAEVPLVTDHNGYLAGRATLNVEDQLVALYPISTTDTYDLYYTSGKPTATALSFTPFDPGGVQTLTVSKDNPLLIFDLDLSLEWDARNDDTFYTQLETAIKQASTNLYDVSNGQVAIGQVNVYQAKENWTDSHIIVYGSNGIRPSANIGGVVLTSTHDIGITGVISDAYTPGQIRMGPNWDPFGQNSSDLSQDWRQALAHELSHYLLFMPDNYIGISDGGSLVGLDCQGSFMTNTYDEDYSEFLTSDNWIGDCLQTIAARTTGRADWETINTFYPMINYTGENEGPTTLPLAVTEVNLMPIGSSDVENESETLDAENYDIRNEDGGALLALLRAQGYLFKTQNNDDLTDDVVMPLGTTSANGDRIKVRGADEGDRLCVFGQEGIWVGCDTLTEYTSSIPMTEFSDWEPIIDVTPITSRTLMITATLSTAVNNLNVQVFPAHANLLTPTMTSSVWDTMTPVDANNRITFTKTIAMDYGAFEGLVRIWVPDNDDPQEAVSHFYLNTEVWGAALRVGGAALRVGGGNTRGWGAPMSSAEGQLTVFNIDEPYGETGISAFQTLNSVPNLPSWFTVVGHGYRVTLQSDFTDSIKRTLSFDYLQSDVPDGLEYTLNIYHSSDEGSTWQRLSTDVDQDDNRATTLMPDGGAGIYTLISTIEIPLRFTGWNLFAYPVQTTRPVTEALQSINGYYSTVYGYDGNNPTDPWLVYDSSADSWVNTLEQLEYGQGYWIYVSEPITLVLPIDTSSTSNRANRARNLINPPATYYGVVNDDQAEAEMTVTASIGGQQCGQGETRMINGQVVFSINVWSEGQKTGCGALGQTVSFQIGSQSISSTASWDNSQVRNLPLSSIYQLYLPLIAR